MARPVSAREIGEVVVVTATSTVDYHNTTTRDARGRWV